MPRLGLIAFVVGTSPRLWGDWMRNMLMIKELLERYIPTLVGRFFYSRCVIRTHTASGTSPRLWGDSTIASPPGVDCKIRYIPTLVGRFLSVIRFLPRKCSPVHPHACGEISQPHFRCLYPDCAVHPHACGEIQRPSWDPRASSVHPHACGEIIAQMPMCDPTHGTSPRLWGDFAGHK